MSNSVSMYFSYVYRAASSYSWHKTWIRLHQAWERYFRHSCVVDTISTHVFPTPSRLNHFPSTRCVHTSNSPMVSSPGKDRRGRGCEEDRNWMTYQRRIDSAPTLLSELSSYDHILMLVTCHWLTCRRSGRRTPTDNHSSALYARARRVSSGWTNSTLIPDKIHEKQVRNRVGGQLE